MYILDIELWPALRLKGLLLAFLDHQIAFVQEISTFTHDLTPLSYLQTHVPQYSYQNLSYYSALSMI